MSTGKDESFARDLLCDYYSEREAKPPKIQLVDDDPPDLLIQWSDEQNWGVEVTRLYDAAIPIGNVDKRVSSESVRRSLEIIGEEINEETRNIRSRNYTLFFESPSPLNPQHIQNNRLPFSDWKRDATTAIVDHITQNKTAPLRGQGFKLTPGELGNRWSVHVATGAHKTDSTFDAAIQSILRKKEAKLPSWKINCKKRWLLILNCYILADDAVALDCISHWLTSSTTQTFQGVFWSGYPERALKLVQPSA